MKTLLITLILFASGWNALAATTQIEGRVAGGYIDPAIWPLGAIVNIENGEVIYVTGIISVLAPNQLDRSCIYSFTTIPDLSVQYKAVKLVPPTQEVSCGHDFSRNK